jgi:hypothetical protein
LIGRASVAVDRRRGHAPVRIVRHGEFGGDAGVPQNPAAKVRKSQSLRRIDAASYPSLRAVNRTAKNGLPNFRSPGKCRIVRSIEYYGYACGVGH